MICYLSGIRPAAVRWNSPGSWRVAVLGQGGGEVDFDELAGVAQRGDSEQGAGGGEGQGELRGVEVIPCAAKTVLSVETM